MNLKPAQTLPDNYSPASTLDLSKDNRALVLMNLLAVGILALSGYVFLVILIRLRPVDGAQALSYSITGAGGFILALAYIAGLYAAVIVLHEAVHGIFFWIFTRTRPKFAFKIWYAYAAAPGWYLPRNLYALVAISPLVVLSLLGMLLFLFIPAWMLLPVFMFITFNASGAVGDIVVLFWLFSKPPSCLAHDQGDTVTLYIRVGS